MKELRVSPEELKRAFRLRAKALHPDLHPDNPHAAEDFKELNKAYAAEDYGAREGRGERTGAVEERRRSGGGARVSSRLSRPS